MSDKINAVISASLDFPEEILFDLPITTIIGNKNLTVQNFIGIREYSSEKVKIKIKKGFVVVEGEGLCVCEINAEYIKIKGRISNVVYNMGDRDE